MQDVGIRHVTKLAEHAQVTRNTIYNWEGGITAPALDELDKVARALDLPLSALVDAWSGRQIDEETAPPWAERLLAKVDAIYERQSRVAGDATQAIIEALSSPEKLAQARLAIAELEERLRQRSEAPPEKNGTEGPGAGSLPALEVE